MRWQWTRGGLPGWYRFGPEAFPWKQSRQILLNTIPECYEIGYLTQDPGGNVYWGLLDGRCVPLNAYLWWMEIEQPNPTNEEAERWVDVMLGKVNP